MAGEAKRASVRAVAEAVRGYWCWMRSARILLSDVFTHASTPDRSSAAFWRF